MWGLTPANKHIERRRQVREVLIDPIVRRLVSQFAG
jgi:hypothetical protein